MNDLVIKMITDYIKANNQYVASCSEFKITSCSYDSEHYTVRFTTDDYYHEMYKIEAIDLLAFVYSKVVS